MGDDLHALSFSAFGVSIRVEANQRGIADQVQARLGTILPQPLKAVDEHDVDRRFTVLSASDGSLSLSLDGAPLGSHASPDVAITYLASRIKLAIGEHATSHVFLHAGVVAIGGSGVVLPASSCQGKTTLVRELVRRGAIYYSDDFAPIDRQGLVSPFPKPLSIRPEAGDLRQVEQTVESLGGVVGETAISVDVVLFTHYHPAATWQPKRIGAGAALLGLLPHTLPIRAAPERALAALGRMVAGADLWESPRGEVENVADWLFASLLQSDPAPRP